MKNEINAAAVTYASGTFSGKSESKGTEWKIPFEAEMRNADTTFSIMGRSSSITTFQLSFKKRFMLSPETKFLFNFCTFMLVLLQVAESARSA